MHLQGALQVTHHDVFLSANDIVTGDRYRPIIFKNIANCDIFVLIGTDIALNNPWVEEEVSEAQRRGKEFAICIHHKVEKGFRETRVGKKLRGYRYERIYDFDGGGGSQIVRFVTDKIAQYIKSHKSLPQQDSYRKSLKKGISTLDLFQMGARSKLTNSEFKGVPVASIGFAMQMIERDTRDSVPSFPLPYRCNTCRRAWTPLISDQVFGEQCRFCRSNDTYYDWNARTIDG